MWSGWLADLATYRISTIAVSQSISQRRLTRRQGWPWPGFMSSALCVFGSVDVRSAGEVEVLHAPPSQSFDPLTIRERRMRRGFCLPSGQTTGREAHLHLNNLSGSLPATKGQASSFAILFTAKLLCDVAVVWRWVALSADPQRNYTLEFVGLCVFSVRKLPTSLLASVWPTAGILVLWLPRALWHRLTGLDT